MQTAKRNRLQFKDRGRRRRHPVDAALNWFRKNSVWPMPMGLACCAIELMAVGASRFDISRFGSEVMRFSPRQADCMIVAGTVTYKMAGASSASTTRCPNRNGCIAMGACASTGGMYRSYAVLQGRGQHHSRGRLHFRLSAASRSRARRADEIAGKNRQAAGFAENVRAKRKLRLNFFQPRINQMHTDPNLEF
jgi:hypothetical protein